MGLTKYASFAIEAAELAPGAPADMNRMASRAVAEKLHSRPSSKTGWSKQAHRHRFEYEAKPGFLYVRSRAISSRINDNFDGFPAEEIKKAYGSFVGKPVFVNHHNENHRRARGVIIAAALHEDTNPDGSPDTWVEVLMEVDAVRFPKLAQAILAGHIDRTSMGTDVAYSICTFCGNKAATPLEYCAHIPKLKGKRIRRTTASGAREDVLVAEMCYGLGFFENSLLVEDPADPTAYFLGVEGIGVTASVKTSDVRDDPIRASVMVKYPDDADWWAARTGNARDIAGMQKVVDMAIADGAQYRISVEGTDYDWADWQRYVNGEIGTITPLASSASRKTAIDRSEIEAAMADQDMTPGTDVEVVFMGKPWRGQIGGVGESSIGMYLRGEDGQSFAGQQQMALSEISSIRRLSRRTADVATVPIVDPPAPPPDVQPWDWRREKADADRTSDYMELDDDFFAEGRKTAAPKLVPVEKLQQGDEANMGMGASPWTVTSTEPITYDAAGTPGTRVFFAERPQGMSFKNGDTLSVVKPGRRGLTDAEMDARTPPQDNSGSFRDPCPVCRKMISIPNDPARKYPSHNYGSSSSQCPASGKTMDETYEYMRQESQNQRERERWSVLRATAIGEMKAPPKVDTMRESTCPVCGEEDGYNGEECAVCGFVKPPDMFMDPDTDLAGQVDLRQEQQDEIQDAENAAGTGDLVCDNCGTEFDDPDAQEAALPAESITTDEPKPGAPTTPPGTPPDADPTKKLDDASAPGTKPEDKKDDSKIPDDAGAVEEDEDKQKDDLTKKPPVPQDPGEPGKVVEEAPVDGTDPSTDDELQEPDADDAAAQDPETTQPKAGDTCPDCGKGTLQQKSPEAQAPAAAVPPAPGDQEAPAEAAPAKPGEKPEPKPEDAAKPDAPDDGKDVEKDDDDKPPWLKKKKDKAKESARSSATKAEGVPSMPPRPWHLVAAEQQTVLDYNRRAIERIASVAGIDLSDLQSQAGQRIAALRKRADENNPTQPIPDPPSEAPSQSTQEAATPTATDDVTQIGATPLTNVAPDAQTSLGDTGTVLDAPLDLNEKDVTAPVAGTEEVRPLSETRTETEVRAGTPADATGTMFPLQGDMATKPTLGSQQPQAPTPEERAQARLFAGVRLAKLRIATGAESGEEMAIAQRIATDRSLTDGGIMAEIETLSRIMANRPQGQPQQARTAAGVRRTVPSLATGVTNGQPPIQPALDPAVGGLTRPTADEFLFE